MVTRLTVRPSSLIRAQPFCWSRVRRGRVRSRCQFASVYAPVFSLMWCCPSSACVFVCSGCHGRISAFGDIQLIIGAEDVQPVSTALDSIQLSVFGHRFMSIAEQMGRTLQRTAISTNIKERLDFSCALFGPDGGLVANAPHLVTAPTAFSCDL